jgi:putative transposase
MGQDDGAPMRVRWARLRLQIIGTLLASPPEDGELATRIAELAGRTWKHPTIDGTVQYSAKTIERWYYTARGAQDPFRALC